jgi:PPE-repeat protein
MLDFGALPPEVNSSRIYAGPGSDPIMAAASAWQAIATQLDSFARGYTAVLSGLQGETWSGPASTAMAEAAQPYIEWIAMSAAKADETAGHARAAAAAYEAAYAATVPPALVTANRAQYAALVAANIFGQYTVQIAANEAAYAEMWAQDAQAMYSYAASSAAAATVSPFTEPPETTSAAGQSGQSAAVAQAVGTSTASHSQSSLAALMAAVPQQLQTLSAATASSGATSATGSAADPLSSILTGFSDFNTFSSPVSLGAAFGRTFFGGGSFLSAVFRSGIQAKDLPEIAQGATGAGGAVGKAEALVPKGVGGPVLASWGKAAPIGGLSAPQSWASATPVASAVEEPQWMSEADLGAVPASAETTTAGAAGAGPMAGLGGTTAMLGRPTVSNVLRVAPRRFQMPRPALGG